MASAEGDSNWGRRGVSAGGPGGTPIRAPIRTETQNRGGQSHEVEMVQADAWLAICALSKSLDTDYETTSEVWSRAISRTEEWRNLLD
jgi:hypothetical protein